MARFNNVIVEMREHIKYISLPSGCIGNIILVHVESLSFSIVSEEKNHHFMQHISMEIWTLHQILNIYRHDGGLTFRD